MWYNFLFALFTAVVLQLCYHFNLVIMWEIHLPLSAREANYLIVEIPISSISVLSKDQQNPDKSNGLCSGFIFQIEKYKEQGANRMNWKKNSACYAQIFSAQHFAIHPVELQGNVCINAESVSQSSHWLNECLSCKRLTRVGFPPTVVRMKRWMGWKIFANDRIMYKSN